MDAAQLLAAAAHVYRTCRTYADEGTGITTFVNSGHRNVVSFRTRFARPARFRFEYQSNAMDLLRDRMVICADGGEADLWWSLRGARESLPLAEAVTAATGVSAGVAHLVPRLLMPDLLTGADLLDPGAARLNGEAVDEGVECVVVETRLGSRPCVVWLDRVAFLVRKVVFPPANVEGSSDQRAELLGAMRDMVMETARGLGMSEADAQKELERFTQEMGGELDDPARSQLVTTQSVLFRPTIGAAIPDDEFKVSVP